jgi:hypothetical protein
MKRLFLIFAVLLTACFAHAQWEDDVRLTNTPDSSYLTYGMSHSIVTSGDTVHVVWRDKSEGNWEIFYKRSTDAGLNWEPDLRITYDPAVSYTPSLALSGSGLHIVWADMREGNYEIYYDRSIDGGASWEGESQLTDDLSYSYESVVSASGSYVHVVWVNVDIEGHYQIFYKHSPDGGITWATENWLSGFLWYSYNPSIAVSGSDVYVVWNDDRDGNLEIYYIKSSDNGLTWGPEIRLTNDPATSNLPSVAVSGSNVHIVWEDFRDGNSEIYYKGSVDGGANWGDDIRITYDQGNSISPNLAVSNSVLHVVWQDSRSGFYDIFYNYSTDGGETWATDTQLNDFSFSSQRPCITVSDSVLHVVWQDYRDFNYEIYYKRNPTGGLVGMDDEPLSSSGGFISVYPNPASRQLTVDCRQLAFSSQQSAVGGQRSAVRLSIVDLFGREIKAFENISSFPYQADISDLPDGMYFLQVMNEEGKSSSVKFLKIDD